jgi:hypothetical protein
MQVMLDTLATPTTQLRALAQLIVAACDEREAAERDMLPQPQKTLPQRDDLSPPITPQRPPPPPPRDTSEDTRALSADELAAVAAASAPPPPPPPGVGDLDAAGVAYDPNIHSSSRAKLKNGNWKLRRGGPLPPLDPPTQPAAAVAPPPPPNQPPPTANTDHAAPPPAAPVVASAAVVPPPPPAPPTGPVFRTVMSKITAAISTGKLTFVRVGELYAMFGASGISAFMNELAPKLGDLDALVDLELAGK